MPRGKKTGMDDCGQAVFYASKSKVHLFDAYCKRLGKDRSEAIREYIDSILTKDGNLPQVDVSGIEADLAFLAKKECEIEKKFLSREEINKNKSLAGFCSKAYLALVKLVDEEFGLQENLSNLEEVKDKLFEYPIPEGSDFNGRHVYLFVLHLNNVKRIMGLKAERKLAKAFKVEVIIKPEPKPEPVGFEQAVKDDKLMDETDEHPESVDSESEPKDNKT
jgi:hypothetical protein